MIYYSLRVLNVRYETTDCVTVLFKQPGLKPIKYLPGQYLSLIFRINGRRYVRPYSFSSAPGIDSTLNITVKRTPGGVVSNHIIDSVKIGDIIEVMEPMGDFILKDEQVASKQAVYLWAAGSGITPLISIAKYILHQKKVQQVKLFFGNKNYPEIILRAEIDLLQKKFENEFKVCHYITGTPVNDAESEIQYGRITAQEVNAITSSNQYSEKSLHYICGPVGLKHTVKSALLAQGICKNNIFTEDFEIHRDPNDFIGILTQRVSIIKETETFNIEVAAGKSILEAGLDELIDLPYSCQTGNCLICKGHIINGKVKMIGIENLPVSLKSDECLLCSSYPDSGNVEIIIT